ncbi:MAG: M1 family metallopeptidase [bacterium]
MIILLLLISQFVHPEINKAGNQFHLPQDSVITHSYDVLKYNLTVEFFTPYDTLAGMVVITFSPNQNMDTLPVHLGQAMTVDSITMNNILQSYHRIEDTIYVSLTSALPPHLVSEISIYYQGKPIDGLFQAFSGFLTDVEINQAAKQWWPCFDYCWDKADLGIELHITVPENLYPVSNGVLTGIDSISGNRLTFHWVHQHPIATYLVAILASNYLVLQRNYHGYPLIYYAIPGYEYMAEMMLDSTEVIMSLFDTLIDTFPFADEKLGQIQSGGRGAMENQTCIRYAPNSWLSPITHAHEIAHSWWGDALTCINYQQMFINEGTTSYYECLATRVLQGDEGFNQRLEHMRQGGLDCDDQHHWPIINSPDPFGLNVYWKGAWFHHMLRNLIGDTLYYPAMRAFYHQYKGGNASITDLQNTLEQYYKLEPLDWFFQQWLYRPDYPQLNLWWYHHQQYLHINITQVQPDSFIYKIPLELGLWYGNSCSVSREYLMEQRELIIQELISCPDSITMDPQMKLYFRPRRITPLAQSVLIIDDGQSQNLGINYQNICDQINIPNLLWAVESLGSPPCSLIQQVFSIFWITGRIQNPLDSIDRERLNFIITNHYPLAIFSTHAASQLSQTSFLEDTLGVIFSGDSGYSNQLVGNQQDPIGNGFSWYINPVQRYEFIYPSVQGEGCAYFQNSDYGIIRSKSNFQIVFSTVDITDILPQPESATPLNLIRRILQYFGYPVNCPLPPPHSTPCNLVIEYQDNGSIMFKLTAPISAQLTIWDLTGRKLINWDLQKDNFILWDGTDHQGQILPSGRYIVKLNLNNQGAGENLPDLNSVVESYQVFLIK